MPSDRCLSVCLSVTLVYCGQTVGWIEMPLGPGDLRYFLAASPTAQQPHTSRPMSIEAKRSPISATTELLLLELASVSDHLSTCTLLPEPKYNVARSQQHTTLNKHSARVLGMQHKNCASINYHIPAKIAH